MFCKNDCIVFVPQNLKKKCQNHEIIKKTISNVGAFHLLFI